MSEFTQSEAAALVPERWRRRPVGSRVGPGRADPCARRVSSGPRARNDEKDPALHDLSETLRSLPIHTDRPDPDRFRNLNSVYLKLQNFKAIDPEYTGRGLTGLTAGGLAGSKRSGTATGRIPSCSRWPRRFELTPTFAGRIRSCRFWTTRAGTSRLKKVGFYRTHRWRERDPTRAEEEGTGAERRGLLKCEVCGFDFAATYGDHGQGSSSATTAAFSQNFETPANPSRRLGARLLQLPPNDPPAKAWLRVDEVALLLRTDR